MVSLPPASGYFPGNTTAMDVDGGGGEVDDHAFLGHEQNTSIMNIPPKTAVELESVKHQMAQMSQDMASEFSVDNEDQDTSEDEMRGMMRSQSLFADLRILINPRQRELLLSTDRFLIPPRPRKALGTSSSVVTTQTHLLRQTKGLVHQFLCEPHNLAITDGPFNQIRGHHTNVVINFDLPFPQLLRV